MNQGKRKHYWLAAGTVIAVTEESRISINLNTLLTTENKCVTHRNLGETQQAMQMRFVKESFPEQVPVDLKILDVFIQAISYLGHMTDREFQANFAQLKAEQAEAEKGLLS